MHLSRGSVDVLGNFRGAPHTVALIKRYAIDAQRDPSVRQLAEEIIQGLGSKDYISEILAVYYFTLSRIRYANDPRSVELVRKPGWVARQILAGRTPSLDCDDLVAFQAALLLSLGREVRAVTVAFRLATFRGQVQYSHVYLQVKEPKSSAWVNLDPVAAEKTGQMLGRIRAIKYWPIA